MGTLIYSINHLPDLVLVKYQSIINGGIEEVLERNESFLRLWQKISGDYKVDLTLAIEYFPDKRNGERLSVKVIVDSPNDNLDGYFDSIMMSSPLAELYDFKKIQGIGGDSASFKVKGIVKKCERSRNCVMNEKGETVPLYFVETWEGNEESRLYEMFKLMEALHKHVLYRVILRGANDYEKIFASLDKPISFLRKRTINHTDDKVYLSSNELKQSSRDVVAEETLKNYEKFLKKISNTPCYKANIEIYADDSTLVNILLNTVCGSAIKEGDWEINICDFNNGLVYNTVEEISCIMPNSLAYWPTYFTIDEISPFFRLPILNEGENIEMVKESEPTEEYGDIFLGKDINNKEVFLPSKNLKKHMFICGVPGAGKTNTMLHFCYSLWNECNIPFLVLEPAKKEYRALAQTDIENLIIFSPNAGTKFPLAINPFEFAQGLSLSEHIQNLMDVFEGAFPLTPPLPALLDRAIESAYREHGWDSDDVNDGTKTYPVMSEVYERVKIELEETDYDGEVKGNMKSALEMRLGALLRRDLGNVFDVPYSSIEPEDLLENPIIIEMESLGTGPSNFLTLMLCTLVREVLKANPIGETSREIRHVLFIEEAHNLIAADIRQQVESADPKIAATNYLIKMLAEVRALGEGIVIADQLPTAMAPEVLKNTSTKIVHRLISQDDRGLVGSSMSASGLQMEELATFLPGYCLVSFEGLLKPFQMKIASFKYKDIPSTTVLIQLMDKRKYQNEIVDRTFSIQLQKYRKIWVKEWKIMMVVYDKFVMDCNAFQNSRTEHEVKINAEQIVKDQIGLDTCIENLERVKKKYDFILSKMKSPNTSERDVSDDMNTSICKVLNNVQIILNR